MKYTLAIVLALGTLLSAQEPELPGWGIYVGAGMGSAAFEDDMGADIGFEPALPFIGVNKGVMLGLPLVVNVGFGKRSYNMEMDLFGETVTTTTSLDYLDVAAFMPYPLGPGFAQLGALYGTPLGGKLTSESGGMELSEDVESEDLDSDFGLILAYAYPINEQISVNAGYYLGLAEQSDGGPKFNGLFVLLGYTF
tara:strand:- start:962 stop:1546 length:585 start_codon:yes stop_codon:yes gene_type:complete